MMTPAHEHAITVPLNTPIPCSTGYPSSRVLPRREGRAGADFDHVRAGIDPGMRALQDGKYSQGQGARPGENKQNIQAKGGRGRKPRGAK